MSSVKLLVVKILGEAKVISRFSTAWGVGIHAPSIRWNITPAFECGPLIVNAFQREQYEKEEKEKLYSGETWQTLPQIGQPIV